MRTRKAKVRRGIVTATCEPILTGYQAKLGGVWPTFKAGPVKWYLFGVRVPERVAKFVVRHRRAWPTVFLTALAVFYVAADRTFGTGLYVGIVAASLLIDLCDWKANR